MPNDTQDARRYRAMRAYTQAVRDWFKKYPDHKPGEMHDGEVRPWFGTGVILCVTAEDLDSLCDGWLLEYGTEGWDWLRGVPG